MGRRGPNRSEEDVAAPTAQPPPQPQLPWGMEKTEMQPSSLTSLTDDKLARFVLGQQKKTKFQKEREDREAKKRQADEEAAKIYATQLKATASRQLKAEMCTDSREIKQKDAEQREQEMKERGPAPISMEGVCMAKGSFDNGDPETTNLYVGNLAPTVTEEVLQAEFGRYGEVYSVKIMWPRSEEERARRRNCGFVSFYERRDADDARINLDNKELEGQPMIVGWGKAVKIQPRARAPGLLLPPTAPVPSVTTTPTVSTPNADLTGKPTITIEIPTDQEARRRVDNLAHYVAADGLQFENAVRMREANNKAYSFFFEPQSALALYYRWRVYSFAMGDDEHTWRENPFQMTLEGPVWLPPKMPPQSPRDRSRRSSGPSGYGQGYVEKDEKLLTGQQIARARDMERGRERNRLSNEDYDKFKQLLEELTLERESVKKTMGFALDNSEAAVDLANIILESFKNSTSSGVTLIGLLYVTSDVLHNSSAAVKNASLFRTTFQECLPEIMDTLRIAHKNIAGRMSANAMKEKVMNVLTAWESWSLFPPAVLVGLHATFLRKVEENEYIATRRLNFEGIGESDLERLRKTCRQSGIMATGDAKWLAARLQWLKEFTSPTALTAPSVQPSTNSNVKETAVRKNDTNDAAAEAINEVGKENGSVDNLDGEPIDEDLDGDPIDREPIVKESDDIDGEPMDDEALDGEPLDGGTAEDDLDGEPLDGEDLDGAPMDEEDLDGELI
ncbi:hypothetical protein PC128_g18755 [Phytophthora cactorum]|nr:hypothetical protein PC128_g18755 [Phytophthora cactorum]